MTPQETGFLYEDICFCMQGINLDPGNPEAWILSGHMYQKRERHSEALVSNCDYVWTYPRVHD